MNRECLGGIHIQPMNQGSTALDSDLDRYLQQAQRFPVLQADEERRLAERWRNTKDPAAAEQLLGSHLRLVIKIARGFGGYGLPLGDLVAEGSVGLMQALTKFEPERGFRFSTYAMWWVRAAIQEYVLYNRSLVRMGTTAAQKKLFFNLRRLKSRLDELGSGDLSATTIATISEELGVSERDVIEMNQRLSATDQSLATPVADDHDREWGDMLASADEDQEHIVAEASELTWRRELLADGMNTLSERERHILSERRLKDEPLRLEDLSQIYGVSRERVRQIEVRAFAKLRNAMLGATAAAANDGQRAAA